MSMMTIRALALPLIAAAVLLGAAAGLPVIQATASTAAWHGGGCWNKPVLPDWCEFNPAGPELRA
jgi:hypothetical protein